MRYIKYTDQALYVCNIRPKYVHGPIPNILINSSSNFEHSHLKSVINDVASVQSAFHCATNT